jgi:putative tricarboxylic transport membrane protein
MRFSDSMLGGALIVFAVALAGYSWTFPAIPGQLYGAATFPIVIAIGFAGCGIALAVRGLTERGVPLVARTEWTRRPGAIPAVLTTIALVVIYILFARRVGFIPMMMALLIVMLAMLRVPWWQTIPLAIVTTLVIDFVFRSFLLVPLPLGIMPRPPW